MSQVMSYREYLKSESWFSARLAMLIMAKFCCEFCGQTANEDGTGLDVHHLNYDRIGNELRSDLIVLCRGCHSDAHEFPKRFAEIQTFAARREHERYA